jgi:hypothetical protein
MARGLPSPASSCSFNPSLSGRPVRCLSAPGRAGVATLFLHSAEFRGDVVQELYGFTYAPAQSVVSLFANLLHRTSAPAAAEINGWVNSGLDIYTMEIAIAGTSEFVALASGRKGTETMRRGRE